MIDESTTFLARTVDVQIDRPLGCRHPKHENLIYSVNYGFVPGTKSPDGEEIDAYVLGVDRPLKEFRGRCIAVIKRCEDSDDKLIVVPEGESYSDQEIRVATDFQERFFKSIILRHTEGEPGEGCNGISRRC